MSHGGATRRSPRTEERLRDELDQRLSELDSDVKAYEADGWTASIGAVDLRPSPDGRHQAFVPLYLSRPDRRPGAGLAKAELVTQGKPHEEPLQHATREAKYVYEANGWALRTRWRAPTARSVQDLD